LGLTGCEDYLCEEVEGVAEPVVIDGLEETALSGGEGL
jgi:hypothetical protein